MSQAIATRPMARTGTALVIFGEATLFAGLVAAYVLLRSRYQNWPPIGQPRLPVAATGLNTLVLLGAGLALWTARGPARDARMRLALGLGATFLAVQGWEWSELMRFGLGQSGGVYGALFYAVVGTHAAHVAAALVALAWVYGRRDAVGEDGHGAMRLYWSFVVLLWPVLYAVVYLW